MELLRDIVHCLLLLVTKEKIRSQSFFENIFPEDRESLNYNFINRAVFIAFFLKEYMRMLFELPMGKFHP